MQFVLNDRAKRRGVVLNRYWGIAGLSSRSFWGRSVANMSASAIPVGSYRGARRRDGRAGTLSGKNGNDRRGYFAMSVNLNSANGEAVKGFQMSFGQHLFCVAPLMPVDIMHQQNLVREMHSVLREMRRQQDGKAILGCHPAKRRQNGILISEIES